MSISPEDLTIGREANARVKNYESRKRKERIALLIPVGWLAISIFRYEATGSPWISFQLIFWFLGLVAAITFGYLRRRANLRDAATLDRLRKLYGSNISFEENNVESGATEKKVGATEGHDKWKGFEPLFAFCVCLGAMFTMLYLIRFFLPLIPH
jgi:predicted membrane channel-forming protein YqfA (hemolysin III family)